MVIFIVMSNTITTDVRLGSWIAVWEALELTEVSGRIGKMHYCSHIAWLCIFF